ncbi:G-type lectin S-receptor-like serine/threonine-protein kinase At1g11300 [Silene latifolia]|uniref:G-type lectin S-receptor-like serine/threonine-protein kinase At1g11300 n=1 Tax=Silene latifolia TaxID=37657 RepID=UPI003D78974C
MSQKTAVGLYVIPKSLRNARGSGFVSAQSNLHRNQSLRDPESLVSSNDIFRLGFFSPANSTNRYVGIWYTVNEHDGELEVVWVANRDNPVNDSLGRLTVFEDGNLKVLDGQNKSLWSSDVLVYEGHNSVVQLLDTGNLVLNGSGTIIWQSFDQPTDTFLPGMNFTVDGMLTKKQALFWAWKSPSDPSFGKITCGITTSFPPQVFIWDGDRPYWRSEPRNTSIFIGPNPAVLSLVTDDARKVTYAFPWAYESELVHFVLTYDRVRIQRAWDSGSRKWENKWVSRTNCDVYSKCGPFGICTAANSPQVCGCLRGYVPKNQTEWSKGDWTGGCVRRTPLQCGIAGGRVDGFWNMTQVKVPDNAVWLSGKTEDQCINECLSKCSCIAYAYDSTLGCMIWNSTLIDTEELSPSRGIDFSVRLAYSELEQKPQDIAATKFSRWKVILTMAVIIGTVIFGVCIWFLRRHVRRISIKEPQHHKYMNKDDSEEIEFGDLPMFQLKTLITATNNFQDDNKLGRGGFGTVYKGKLEDGEDVAVKRLSKVSLQGIREFMTEILVISKLQHRNLVRLLGCCVEGEEKLLVYEFMPNKSLDALLFGPIHGVLSDWKTRFNIIQGICRGLLYLHRDSRLRIIHRDLKASNILLDDELNPKISDFGMAKIFGGNDDQADISKTVAGTYGYMSPEYAMRGRFSEKSDVFSFGVLLLEIVSGRRSSKFVDNEYLSLYALAWRLWNEDNIIAFIDPLISESTYEANEILRCIQVALLCVQELPEDRPNISMIISMLDGEGSSSLPRPTQPGFMEGRHVEHVSVNHLSQSYINGR